MNAKGNAMIIIIFCNASRPPARSRAIEIRDSRHPHTSLVDFLGFKDPFSDSIARTTVAEFADVIKKENTRIIATIDNISPIG